MKSLHLLYHEIRPEGGASLYVTPRDEFAAHCELLQRMQSDFADQVLYPEITFDDGHSSDITEAAPLLNRFGLRARFFITAGWTGQRRGYMEWEQVRALQQAGHRIGTHGWSHKLLPQCSSTELQRELVDSRRRTEDELGVAITTMSLPGGRANRRVLQDCREAGYLQVFTSRPRAQEMNSNPFFVGRLNLRAGTQPGWLEEVLTPATGRLRRLERTHRVKEAAQGILGDGLYGRLWSVLNRQPVDDVSGNDVEAATR